jgi:predicted lipoprotein with Yx(FWY)xxD motif
MNMKRRSIFTALLSLIVLTTVFSSCSDDDDNTPGPPETKKTINLTNNAKLGNILTDSTGKTLYFFTPDPDGTSKCVGPCEVAWPVFYKANPSLGSGLDAKDFGVITRPEDNKKQTTYKGWPLYYFYKDAAPGETNGEKLENAWFVAKPDYTLMIGHTQLVGENGIKDKADYQPGEFNLTPYFTDDRGVALYTFTKDTDKTNTYTSETDQTKNAVWPIFAGTAKIVVPSVLNAADFAFITVFGNQQLTYKGKPIYKFGREGGRGTTKGVSVPSPGVWPVATAPNIELLPPPAH